MIEATWSHFKRPRPTPPFAGLSTNDWQRCIDLFKSPEFAAHSEKNRANRGMIWYPILQGSKSFIATRYEKADPQTQQMQGLIESFRDFHTFKNGEFVNEEAAVDYDRLCEVRETQSAEVASTAGSMNERAITREVLGTRRGHERGVGRILKGSGSSVPREANEASTSVPVDAARFEELMAEMRHMQMIVAFFKSS